MDSPPDIVLLTVDALRVDHLSCYGYHRKTPTFDVLAERWLDAPTTVSVSSHTREALPPLLSGHYPERFAASGFTQLKEPNTLAGLLRAAGYRTGGFHSNPYVSRAYGFDIGFDTFYDDLLLGQNKFFALAQKALEKFVWSRGEYYARAPEINRRALQWLDENKADPVFIWNHYMDPHGPYHAPETQYAEKEQSASAAESLYRRSWKQPKSITEEERRLLVDTYDDEIRYVDKHLGYFLSALRSRDRLKDALVVVTADHGDAFGEHGYFTHPRRLHEELLRVPLFISPPSGMRGTIEKPVSTLDVVPTLLAHIEIDSHSLPGMPLVTAEGQVSEPEGIVYSSAAGENDNIEVRAFAIRDERWKVICTFHIEEKTIIDRQAFDLNDDPNERDGFDPTTTEPTQFLTERLERCSRARLQEVSNTGDKETIEKSPEINERLEALGYK